VNSTVGRRALSEPTVVMYEDRPRDLVGLQLAVASLLRHSPGCHVRVSVPGAPSLLVDWLLDHPSVEVVPADDLAGSGWNIKPELLRRTLRAGHESVCWLDSDMLVGGDLREALVSRAPSTLMVTDDFWYARERRTAARTLAWGLVPGRVPGCAVNTGLVRVTGDHLPLLDAWQALLEDPRYLHAQSQPYADRPLHLLGDQEVLSALLGSRPWEHIALSWLRRGIDVAQCFGSAGFSPRERLSAARVAHRPLLIHAMGPKPWAVLRQPPQPSRTARRERAHMQLSTYTALAGGYDGELGHALDWTRLDLVAPLVVRAARTLDPALRELPLAVPEATIWQARRFAGSLRRALKRRVPGRDGG
jgi:hypothetical protein